VVALLVLLRAGEDVQAHKTSVPTDKGFEEVYLTADYKDLFENCEADVTSTQVYKHLAKEVEAEVDPY
jgi:hypothetical protein